MKKLNGIFCAVMLVVFLFTTVSAVCATSDKENFQKAGMVLKGQAEKDLNNLAMKAMDHFYKMPKDGYFAKPNMWSLEHLVKSFEKSKIDYDKALKLYGLQTEMVLDPIYRKVVDIYFLRDEMDGRSPKDFFYGDSKNETIRRIFAERFGVDVKVWRGMNKAWGSNNNVNDFIFLAVLSCIVCLICWVIDMFRFRWTVYFVLFWFLFFILPI